jgi:glycosyltransferase involved in cell wall biosynthesis
VTELPRPRIGLNAHLLSLTATYRGAGINGYIYQLLRHLPDADATMDYVAYLYDRNFRPEAGLTVEAARWDTRSPSRRIVWEQTRLAAASRGLNLLHGLAYATPLAAACPTVVSVHDLSFMHFPEAFRAGNRLYLSVITRISARRARRVITGSESTRQDVIALCGVPAERVVNIPDGVTAAFCPADPQAVAAFRERKGLPDRFILYLGTLEPRKNVVRLLDAYAAWRRSSGEPVSLVVAGGKGWFYETIFARAAELGLGNTVIFPGFVPGDELPWWYRAAELFVYPSRFEGFGLPVLEAMACGTPTITSKASSLPEVAGSAALQVDPEDTAGLTDAIARVLSDHALAAVLRAAGPRQAAHFPWTRTAAETAGVYREVLRSRGHGGVA